MLSIEKKLELGEDRLLTLQLPLTVPAGFINIKLIISDAADIQEAIAEAAVRAGMETETGIPAEMIFEETRELLANHPIAGIPTEEELKYAAGMKKVEERVESDIKLRAKRAQNGDPWKITGT